MIKSYFIEQSENVQSMLLETYSKDKHFYCSMGLGTFKDNCSENLTEVGQMALRQLAKHSESLSNTVNFVEVKVNGEKKVDQAIKNAENESALFFVCENSALMAEVFLMLNLQGNKIQST